MCAERHTLEADDERKSELVLAACSNDSIGNGATVDNSSKDVDKNSLDLERAIEHVGKDERERRKSIVSMLECAVTSRMQYYLGI